MDQPDMTAFEAEFEREIAKDDDSAAREMLAAGRPIHIMRNDTPPGHIVRIYPDGREELVAFDLEAASTILGR